MNALVRRCERIDRPNYRSRGRPNKSQSEVIRHDLKTLGLVEGMARIEGFGGLELRLWILDSGLSIFPLDLADLEATGARV